MKNADPRPERPAPLLRIDNLHVRYGPIEALHGVSLQIAPGEVVALIGANGAGKTTLLRTLSGLLRPSEGTILWNAGEEADETVELHHMAPHQIVRLGISHAPEGRQVFAGLTVRENLMVGAYQRKGDLSGDMERCYGLFPVLAERRSQRAGTLSGGEQQMLAIARALMAHPRLLLLDEPSLGLAPLVVQKIFQIIQQITREGATLFLVEQNAHMALRVADRAYILQSGQIIKTDAAANLLSDPQVKAAYLGG